MSVCAVMLVKDERDVIGPVLAHLDAQVDAIIVSDNGSTDGTRQALDEFAGDRPHVLILDDDEVGYWQSRKTTDLAQIAWLHGHSWVVPCDADEVWYANGRRLGAFLDGIPPDVQIVTAELYNHLPTLDDLNDPNPLTRITWRQRERAPLPKVAARLDASLVIHAGNHGASYEDETGRRHALTAPGLVVRHFSWRSPEQYLRKIRNGEAAYAATSLPQDLGAHWRAFAGKPDEAVIDHFRRWFLVEDPASDRSLIYDPAPLGRGALKPAA